MLLVERILECVELGLGGEPAFTLGADVGDGELVEAMLGLENDGVVGEIGSLEVLEIFLMAEDFGFDERQLFGGGGDEVAGGVGGFDLLKLVLIVADHGDGLVVGGLGVDGVETRGGEGG